MVETQTQTVENKSGIGWGVVLPAATIIGSTLGAVIGFGGLDDLFADKLPEISQDSINDLSAAKRGLSGTDRLNEWAVDNANKAADFLQDQLNEAAGLARGTKDGIAGIRDSLLGAATTQETRQAIGEALQQVNPNDTNNPEVIKEFIGGSSNLARYGEDFLIRDSVGNVFIVDDEALKAIDPKKFGGVLDAITRFNNGFDPSQLNSAQQSFEKDPINWGDIGVKTAVGTAVGLTAGVALKSSVENNQQMTHSQQASYSASSKIEPTTANYLGLAMKSKELNRAMG